MASAVEYMRAFRRNCPGVRIQEDEELELIRLFLECQKDAKAGGADEFRNATRVSNGDNDLTPKNPVCV